MVVRYISAFYQIIMERIIAALNYDTTAKSEHLYATIERLYTFVYYNSKLVHSTHIVTWIQLC